MTMGTISDIIGLIFLIGVGVYVWRSNRPSRLDHNRVDRKMYED